MRTSDERENFSKPNSDAGISSKEQTAYKIRGTVVKMDCGTTQRNGPEDKIMDDDVQSHTPER